MIGLLPWPGTARLCLGPLVSLLGWEMLHYHSNTPPVPVQTALGSTDTLLRTDSDFSSNSWGSSAVRAASQFTQSKGQTQLEL